MMTAPTAAAPTREEIDAQAARYEALANHHRARLDRDTEQDHYHAVQMTETTLIATALRAYAEAREAVPVAWQRRQKHAGGPVGIRRWVECAPFEGEDIASRDPRFEYRACYPAPPTYAAGYAAGLEAAAKVADDMYGGGPDYPYDGGSGSAGFNDATQKIKAAILALKDQP